ncbi:enoyl-CoA hydratase/isomerase family protein [Azoarcus taiwanensis]|uniref:3-hydroxyisobutyryl-CoA hydrolase n=1 Tax=Azoarcus taiwanensis TaxID=666964 RepID=A0A972FFG0_9RHOO|nr:enoyl-CoA hydratase/isomerase family protein [Azoarcus taiwanensis]NMG04608.1 enoyl-CoA hydratase/isomerase family protein [Azoarcus taiwanensis]
MDDCVILREFATACGRRFGHATLNAPKSLNALSLAMIDRLALQLDAWAADPTIVGVLLDGSGDRAFCAGGDVAALYHAIQAAAPGEAPAEAKAFFEREYRLDYRIHTYPKPIVCWGHGIVMGGGIGLLAGASHRVVTPTTRMAMPEISIGLYPDVGGSWFLRRMPGRTGLFLALSGAPLNAADARFAGLADFIVADDERERLTALIADTRWDAPVNDASPANHARLGALLDRLGATCAVPASPLRKHFDCIEAVIGHDGLADISRRLTALAEDADPWLASAGKTFVRGAPSSAQLSWVLWQRTRHLSLADVFRTEYHASVACTAHGDFAEGVRALLIDKDRKPRWQYASLAETPEGVIEDHFRPRYHGPHPLSDLV